MTTTTKARSKGKARQQYKDNVREQVAAKVEEFDEARIEDEDGDLYAAYTDLATHYQGANPVRILAQDDTVTGLADVAAWGTWVGRGRIVTTGEESHIKIIRVVEFGKGDAEGAPEPTPEQVAAGEKAGKAFGVKIISLFHIRQTHEITDEDRERLARRAERIVKAREGRGGRR